MGRRSAALADPRFIVAVAVLAVNDHVLKDRFPGLITGKLSDVAGVAMVATLAFALVGWRWAAGLTAVGFAALKTVPGVAEWAAPVLGGVSRRDPTDLAALLVLVPTVRWLRRVDADERRTRPEQRLLRLLAVVAAVWATSATSCESHWSITAVAIDDRGMLVATARTAAESTPIVWSSVDGMNWAVDDGATVAQPIVESCAGDVCYRVVPRARVDRCIAGTCTTVHQFSADQIERMKIATDGACDLDIGDTYRAVATGTLASGSSVVVVAMGTHGVLLSLDGQEFRQFHVGEAAPVDSGGPPLWWRHLWVTPAALIVLAPAQLLLHDRARRRGTAAWTSAAAGIGIALVCAGMSFFGVDPRVVGMTALILSISAVLAATVVGRLRTPIRVERAGPTNWPPRHLPPPPPPPPRS